MPAHNFILTNCDTDSISFCKQDGTLFTKEEQTELLVEINALLPERIRFEHDGYFTRFVVVKAKNYLYKTEDGKTKVKGSGLKATNKEPALKSFINETIDLLLNDKQDQVGELYHRYVLEALRTSDISRWSTKKTVTKAVLNPERTNEQNVFDAIANDSYQEGDKVYVYFTPEGTLKQSKDWTGDHCPYRLLEKLYKTAIVFSSVIDKKIFVNYSLKTKRKLLEQL